MSRPFLRILSVTSLLALLAAPAGAQVSVGVNAAVSTNLSARHADTEFGLHLARTFPAWNGVRWRPSVEVSVTRGERYALTGPVGQVRLDVVALSPARNGAYFGGGVGSGALLSTEANGSGLPAAVFSPLLLLNVVGVYGRDFGAYSVEGLVRVGMNPGVGVRFDLPLR